LAQSPRVVDSGVKS